MKKILTIFMLSVLLLFFLSGCSNPREILYVGTYDMRGSEGLYVYEFDRGNQEYALLQTLPQVSAPNFLAIAPSGKYLYSVNTMEGAEGGKVDGVSAFRIDRANGRLELLNQVPAYGRGACHIETDRRGLFLYISHYGSGSLAVFGINPDGSIADSVQTIQFEGSSITERQKSSHLHSILVSHDNRFAYAADLGTDRIMIFERDRLSGRLTPALQSFAASIPGSGPRHMAFSIDGTRLYLAEELSCAVSVFSVDTVDGALTRVQTLSTLPADFDGWNTVADIHLAPDGKRLYVSNRGHNSLAVFSVSEDGTLVADGHVGVEGEHPRNFMVDPVGEFLLVANRDTDNITRLLAAGGELPVYANDDLELPAPVCLKWLRY